MRNRVRAEGGRAGTEPGRRHEAGVRKEREPQEAGRQQAGTVRITAVTCVKNEGPFLLEWIAFNRVIGVSDFLFYSNDCDDATDTLLDALAGHGIVHHLPNPAQGRNYQMEALKDARRQEVVRKADWVWIADVDEFLNIHVGKGTIPELIAACGTPQAISLSFQFFANGGIERFEDRPVIEQFRRTHNPDIWCDQLAIEVKTLVRADFPLQYYGAHRPFLRKGAARAPRWTDGSGREVPQNFLLAASKRRIRRFPARGARAFATLNHYALRSLESYLVKNARGDVNRAHRSFDDSYWRERNDDAWQEESILRYRERLLAELDRLGALPGIAALHRETVRRHRARIRELLEQPFYRELRARLSALPTIPPPEARLIGRLERGLEPL